MNLAIIEIDSLEHTGRKNAHFIVIAALFCALKDYDNARKYYELFDSDKIHQYNFHIKNYYQFVQDLLGYNDDIPYNFEYGEAR